ncbi:MAG: FHA domain-containing protein [Arachnia sp.]
MSDLIVAAIKIVFLILLWLFILFVADVVRTDMFGRPVPAAAVPGLAASKSRRRQAAAPAPASITRFAVTQGAQQGLSVPATETINLGRAADSSFQLDDDYSSARHAQLVRRDALTWVITDLRSTNGTFVNGRRITDPTPVTGDDVIRIGTTLMRLEP